MGSRIVGKVGILDLHGRVTIEKRADIHQVISDLNAKKGVSGVLLNMRSVSSIDLSGLAEITKSNQDIMQTGGRFGVFGLGEKLKWAFKVAHLDRAVAVFKDEAEAVAAFSE